MLPSPIPIRLKNARNRAKLSQKELGIRAGIDENSASPRMNQYEKGKHAPDIDLLRRIAKELEVPMSYFFCEDDTSAEIVRHLDQLSQKDKEDLLSQIINKAKN